MKTIKEGDYVILYLAPNKKFLVRVKKGGILHTHEGFIKHDDIIGLRYGDTVTSNIGKKFFRL